MTTAWRNLTLWRLWWWRAIDFEELGETLVPSSFCEEEEVGCKEELHLSPYKAVCFHQEGKLEVTKGFYSSSFLVFSYVSYRFRPIHPYYKCTNLLTTPSPMTLHQEILKWNLGSLMVVYPWLGKLMETKKWVKCSSPYDSLSIKCLQNYAQRA